MTASEAVVGLVVLVLAFVAGTMLAGPLWGAIAAGVVLFGGLVVVRGRGGTP